MPPTSARPTFRFSIAPSPVEPWEQQVLRLLAEQAAIPLDQLVRYLGVRWEQAEAIADHLCGRGYAASDRILYDEPPLLWPTDRGCYLSGTGFTAVPPRVGALARLRAANEIRVLLAQRAPEARFVCGRAVYRDQGYRGHRLSGVLEVEGERHALLALLRPKLKDLLVPRLESHMRHYDALIVFAHPRARSQIDSLAAAHRWPKLVITDLPARPAQPNRSSTPS